MNRNHRLDELVAQWRQRLDEAESRYKRDKTDANLEAWLKALRVFTKLIVDGEAPSED